ncbi:MAG TPA: indole-3-glycerol-phosphate synthase [Gammaproteobacteria bacterium]|jgi:indole-3-glycerol phosphate synthase|nr:indole-3-glycerol-phosphate synthase [Gammaproteobacteria bacterium]
MKNRLEPILLQKKREVIDLYHLLERDPGHPIAKALHGDLGVICSSRFKSMLRSSSLAVIAEIKRKSPSKGEIAPIADPVGLAKRYISGGASALSILTDNTFFGGHMNDLAQVSKIAQERSIPVMRKDFIIDNVQIAEAAVAGASAVLCIIAAVGYQAKEIIAFSHSLGLDVLVEIHDRAELNIALDCGADIIGVNNRNLNTFEVDEKCALKIVSDIPDTIIKVAESGISDPALARRYYHAGFDAVLIGEALVRSTDPDKFINACCDD